MKDFTTEELIQELLDRGFKWGYLSGHGDCEYVYGEGGLIIGDIEKTNVLIRPEDLYKEPIESN